MQLKSRWLTPVIMTLITCVIISIMNLPELRESFQDLKESKFLLQFSSENSVNITRNMFFSAPRDTNLFNEIISWAALLAEFILAFANLSVYIKMSHGPEPVTLSSFIEGLSQWAKGIVCGLWKSLWVFLWSLLFIIPGIVKAYAYSQTEYLLLEYPELSVTKAMKISIQITRGHKGDLFIQDLSFIGWAILASIPMGLGWLWLTPYISMTKVNAFHGLLKDAVTGGVISQEDLSSSY